jgi:DNA-binding NarL/FixJ family response regulator
MKPKPASDPTLASPASVRPQKKRLLLVDDHPIFRQGLATVLEPEQDLMVCGQAVNARDALKAVAASKPDLALVDVSLENSHGIELLKDLKAYHPNLPVIILSMHDEMLYAESALRAGAKGYVMKREPPEKLLEAIRKVLRGGLAFSDQIAARLLQVAASGSSGRAALPTDRLSDRERQILELIGQGIATRKIAESLHISIKTVQTHRENLKLKLELADGLSLIRFAVHWLESEEQSPKI